MGNPYEFELLFTTFVDYMNYVCDTKLLTDNACYYQCSEGRCAIETFPEDIRSIIVNMLNVCAFIPSIDYQIVNIRDEYIKTQQEQNETHIIIQKELTKWVDAFLSVIDNQKKLQKCFLKYLKSNPLGDSAFKLREYLGYIFQQICPLDKQNNIPLVLFNMIEKEVFSIRDAYYIIPFYPRELLIQLYKDNPSYSKASLQKHKREFTRAVNSFNESELPVSENFCYDSDLSLFTCSQSFYFQQKFSWRRIRYFLTLEEMEGFANVDLHGIVGCANIQDEEMYEVEIRKEYQKDCFGDGDFVVTQRLYDDAECIHEHIFETKYLFDLIYYLNFDLSDIDLILCDGLDNVKDFMDITLTNASMQSRHALKFGLTVQQHPFLNKTIEIAQILNNEMVIAEPEHIEPYNEYTRTFKIKYISDLHLIHRIAESNCISIEDIIYLFTQISKEIAPAPNEILIIAGDTSSDFELLKLFTEVLNEHRYGYVIFVLGNHELWYLQDKQTDNLFEDYQEWFDQFYNLFLLQNNLLYLDSNYEMQNIPEEDLQECDITTIDAKLKTARCVFFGGLAFAGNNEEYNADVGLYQNVVTRQEERRYSHQFSNLYHKLLPILQRHSSIVATHMPLNDWDTSFYDDNIFYISGHTHRNYFYDDGVIKIYADNQIGYKNKKIAAKYFYLNPVYDFFQDLPDGIHEISREDYTQFMRGRNIHMTFSRDINKLYVIKKIGYYCFLHENQKGTLSILNGGSLKHISEKTAQSVYDKMDLMIAHINGPLTQYSNLQKQVSIAIQNMGGDGTIHGCIVDIDFYSHLFVLPNGQIIPYYAYDMVRKIVFPSLPQLLQKHAPALHANYLKMIEGAQDSMLPIKQQSTQPVLCLETDIYRVSREIKKMQRPTAGVLSYWDDNMLTQQTSPALPPIIID